MNFVKDITFNTRKKRTKEELKKGEDKRLKQKDEDSKMVSGVFKNIEAPGGDLEFAYKAYKEDPIRVYYFKDGEKYTIPIGVAKHLNNTTSVAQRDYAKAADGTPLLTTIIKSKRQRYQFLSTEYM